MRLPAVLPALPFRACELMLPGESMQCHLFEPHLVSLFEDAMDTGDGQDEKGLFVQALGKASHACAPVMQVVEWRAHSDSGYQCQLKCIGRAMRAERRTLSTAIPEGHPRDPARMPSSCRVCISGPWCDAATTLAQPEPASIALLHQDCVQLAARLDAVRGFTPMPPAAQILRYEWGHDCYLPAFEESLADSFQRRKAILRHRGMDCAPAPTLASLHTLWGLSRHACDAINDDVDARAAQQLLSFACCAELSRAERTRAAVCRDTHKRFLLAEAGLLKRRNKLRASLAIEEATVRER